MSDKCVFSEAEKAESYVEEIDHLRDQLAKKTEEAEKAKQIDHELGDARLEIHRLKEELELAKAQVFELRQAIERHGVEAITSTELEQISDAVFLVHNAAQIRQSAGIEVKPSAA